MTKSVYERYRPQNILSKPVSRMNRSEKDLALLEVHQAARQIKGVVKDNPDLLDALAGLLRDEAENNRSRKSRKDAEAIDQGSVRYGDPSGDMFKVND